LKQRVKTAVKCNFLVNSSCGSNNEDTPVLIEPGETRYWVRKINPLKNDDTSFLQKLITEIPAFLYFLQHRQLTTDKESRMWFSPQQIHTPALDRIINCSRNHTEIDLAEISWIP